MPASEAAAMEAASHAVAETTGVGETRHFLTHAVAEAANMPEAARMAETATAEMGDTYAVETHAVMEGSSRRRPSPCARSDDRGDREV